LQSPSMSSSSSSDEDNPRHLHPPHVAEQTPPARSPARCASITVMTGSPSDPRPESVLQLHPPSPAPLLQTRQPSPAPTLHMQPCSSSTAAATEVAAAAAAA
ncbi:hypothetical protein PFISCL1PPCAC_13705, partial [Pristionchus fissidentatus]